MTLFAGQDTLLRIAVAFPFVLAVVVFFHELGHFLVGRWCGVQVDVFSLGFGRELFGFTDRHGTRWRLSAVPLGGFVKFHGDANAASMPAPSDVAGMGAAERATTFAAQAVWKRAAIVAAGPFANFVLALAIFTATFSVNGRNVLLPRIGEVAAGTPAARAGFMGGDYVISIDGQAIGSFEDMKRIVSGASDVPLMFKLDRAGTVVTLQAAPERTEVQGPFGVSRDVQLGVRSSIDPADVRSERLNIVQAFGAAADETWSVVDRTGSYIGGLFSGRETTAQMSGPIGIARVSGEVAKLGFGALMTLAAFLSISIGLINLAPIPLLDGGHLMYFAFEAVRGRPLNEKVQEFGFRLGLAMVSILMVFATYNDVSHLPFVARLFH